ncbi:MAG: tetratricopeptide repeat protein [Phycisphaerales bacterium]
MASQPPAMPSEGAPREHRFEIPAKSRGDGRRAGPRGAKRLVFIVMAMLIPLAVVGVAEVALRIFGGFGGYPPTIRPIGPLPEQPGSVLHVTDNAGPRTWFINNPHQPGALDDQSMVMPKPPGLVRIIAVGESAMKGFPQPRALTSTRFLEWRWRAARPGTDVEVINLGVTAIASYPVLGILSEALEYQPDAVVIYVGNNEFFGSYGVASLNRAGTSPTAMMLQRRLRSTAIVQAIQSMLRRAPGPDAEGKTLMETMMGRAYIAPDDPLRERAASNLKFFVTRMIERCKARGVPVIVCTLPSNLRDLAPLGDTEGGIVDAAEKERVGKIMLDMSTRVRTDPEGAERDLLALTAQYPMHARAWYWLGALREKQGKIDDAATAFQKAADFDPMPWRPPFESNSAIRSAVGPSGEGVVLCDLEAAFASSARGTGRSAPGWDLMDDHVHPSLEGQDLVSRTLLASLTRIAGPAALTAEQLDAGLKQGFLDVALALGANDFERFGVAHQMRVLGRIGFFKETNPGMAARFDDFCNQVQTPWDPKLREAALEWQKPQTHAGAKRPISGMAARTLLQMGLAGDARAMFESAVNSVFPYSSWSLEYELLRFGILQKQGGMNEAEVKRARAALARGEFLLARPGPDSGMTERHVGLLCQLVGDDTKSVAYLNSARMKLTAEARVAAEMALMQALARLGRLPEAIKVASDGAANAGAFAPQYQKALEALRAAENSGQGSKPANQQSNK